VQPTTRVMASTEGGGGWVPSPQLPFGILKEEELDKNT
jgi:hypothetical protein